MSRSVLITGAGGFVGRTLATGFADLGWRVIGLDRSFDAEAPGDDRIEAIRFEMEERLPATLPRVDLVVHGAWVTTDPETLGVDEEEYRRLNLGPVRAIAHYCRERGPSALVFLSSSGVFGADDGDEGLEDGDEPTGTSAYARAKREAEAWLAAPGKLGSTAPHVVRLGYLFGPGEVERPTRHGLSLVARWLTAARSGAPVEVRADDPIREWTYAPDLAPALERVGSAAPAGRPVHVGSPHRLRDSELAGLIVSAFPGVPIREVPSEGRVKPPMVSSGIPELDDFFWTSPAEALRSMLGRSAGGVAATGSR